MPYLIQKQPDGSVVKQWDLRDKPLTVGRGDQVNVQIEDNEMSRQHFVISPKGGGYLIQDLNSRNGTHVNGQRISETALKPNDKIRAGQTQFVFVEGLATIIGKLEGESKGYGTHLREISKEAKP
jgi:pSer/pThr/pTyr-binding forkhead associated (FHA) protein